MRYSDIDKLIRQKLSGIYPDRESGSICRLVLESVTGSSWVQIRLNYEKAFTPVEENLITEIIARLEKHEPVQYVLGETEFYGLKLKVRPGVLIPRGETEELVEWIVKCNGSGRGPRFRGDDKVPWSTGAGRALRVLDIGCGSGAIAIALAKYLPDAEVIAADISEEALQLTCENAALNNLIIETFPLNILDPNPLVIPANAGTPLHCSESYDIIVSNPPYVPLSEMIAMDLHVIEYEPKMALYVPDNDPLVFYRAIAEFAASHLNPGGQVFVEIHDRLGQETFDVFRKCFLNVDLRKDIHGKDRMIRASNG